MEVREQGQSINIVFLKYLLSMGCAFALSIVLSFFLFNLLIARGWIVPSNATESEVLANRTKIAEDERFDEELIPERAKYVFLSDDGRIIGTDMTDDEVERAIRYHKQEELSASSGVSHMEIKRKDGYVVILYPLKSYYNSAWMNRHFPEVDKLLLFMMSLLSTVSGLSVTIFWAKKLTKQLNLMVKVSEKIAEEDLNFEVEYSTVREFNRVLESLDEMKSALSESLRTQWGEQERRKDQISALLHDVKTPVAVVKGNAELLKETDLSEEQKIYVDYIVKNADRMTEYTKALMLVNKTETNDTPNFETMSVRVLGDCIAEWIKEIASTARRPLIEERSLDDRKIRVDVALLERAVQNIATNAIEYSPEHSEIILRMTTEDACFDIEISDCGQGFTASDTVHGIEPFYRGDSSRHSAEHYGLGLYSVDRIIRHHDGRLSLNNREDREGAAVTISLPLAHESQACIQ